MKGSIKLLIASLIVLAAAIGFFVGSVCMKPCPKGPGMMPPPPPGMEGQAPKGFEGQVPPPQFDGQNPPQAHDGKMPPPDFDGKMPPPPPEGFEGEGPHGDHHKGPHGEQAEDGHGPKDHKGPHGPEGAGMMPPTPGMGGPGMLPPGMKGPKQKGPNPEMMDSLLQITPEQKTALEKNRTEVEETFKTLRKNKLEAEKALAEALDSENAKAVEAAKAKVLEAQKALLDHRVNAVTALSKILTKEQREKFRQFHKEDSKK